MSSPRKLKFCANNEWLETKSGKYLPVYNPSTGEVQAETPLCTREEIEHAIACAKKAFPAWADTPVARRVQVLYKFRTLLEAHVDELTEMCAREHGKTWEEAQGDVLKVKEPVELACGAPSFMMGESLFNTSKGFDSVLYREPLGVYAGIVPFNFPAMIPFGWIAPLCIACGNTLVIKAALWTPMTCFRLMELMIEAGLPAGVINVLTCSNDDAEVLTQHPDIRGVTFVGSVNVGRHVYATAAANGKRVQALTGAKNHALVLDDACLERSAKGIISSSFGCAGERCMALPVVVAHEAIADKLVALLKQYASELKVGPGYVKASELGPLATEQHRQNVVRWIEAGVKEGAKLVLDGRGVVVKGFEGGFYLGPTIFDHVTPEMSIGREEVFGPVLCVKRVKTFEEGLELMNSSRFANGSVIFTQSGYYAREFAVRTHGGMVGINVGIPVPMGIFPFTGHKQSFFGDMHTLGKDGVRFYTESKVVTTKWFDEVEMKVKKVGTWDGQTIH